MGGSAIHHGEIRYDGVVTGEGAPYGSIVANLDGVSVGAELDHLNAAMSVARGTRHPGSLTINARDSSGRSHSLVADFSYLPQSLSVRLTELTLGLPDGIWRLAASAKFDTTPDAIAVDELRMINGRQQLTLEGNLGRRGTQNFRIIASQLDLRSFNPLARQRRKFDGVVSANVRVNGTASAPLIDAMINANQVRVNDQLIGEVSATLRYQAGRAAIDATAHQDVQDQVTVRGTIPVALEWAQGFKAKLSGDTDLKITSARLKLGPLAALAPGKVRDFEGLAAIDLILRGPVMQPTFNGSIRLAGVKGEIVPLGVKVSEMHARIEIDERAMRVVSLAAESGTGTIDGAGAIMLHDYSPTAVQLNVKFNRWPAIDTREYQATIGGNLAMEGTLDAPRVHGQIEVLNGTIHPDLAFLTASTPLAPDETITVIQPGQHDQMPATAMALPAPALPPPPQVQPTRFNKLAMDVMVLIHRNTWIRHENAVAELDGHLHIVKQPQRPVTVAGEVNTLRGWLGYQNKRFTLETGHVTFAGGPQIDPMLDIDARYTLPNYIIDVVVGGTAKKPTIQLKSQPALAQADILSLLLFGKTTGTLNQGQQASLQQNAARMATGFAASEVSQAVSNSLGLESMGVELSDISGTGGRIGFGRYLGENTYISASQTVGTTQNQQDRGQKISVQYFITRWLSVTTSNSTNGSREVDLTISKQF
jgi:translocation and assembly module TamB